MLMIKLKRKIILSITAVVILILCPACFEIVEEVNLNTDGSGSFCFTLNLSQSKLDINAMLLLDSINGRAVPKVNDLKKTLAQVETTLKNDSSITNVAIAQNWENYIFSISGNFKNVDALNKAIAGIYAMFNKSAGQSLALQDNFSYGNKIFKRLYNNNLSDKYNSLSGKDKLVFKNAKYTSVYRFKSPVSSYTNTQALKSKSGMSVMFKSSIMDLITNQKTIENSIYLN
jgi:hypothetical protein